MNIKFKSLRQLKRIISKSIIIILGVTLINSFTISKVNAEEQNGDINNESDINSFMDNFFKEKMEKYSVPGAAVVVVKNNKEVFKKGYGYSNVEEMNPVNPDETLFPAGSVSKLFTATAIMKLYEEGKINLDEDVTNYISPYKIINKYDEKVTCRNLLTHSSGLDEESELNVSSTNYDLLKPQEYYFDIHPLKVTTKPNTICRYSNIGYNLLGYVIEKVSGQSYEEYIKKQILNPLNMTNSLVREKNTNTAIGYEYDGRFVRAPFSYQYTSGSSGIISTVKDMENFIIANLNNGEINENRILNSESMDIMHDKQFSNSEDLPGMGFGAIRSYRNNKRIIKHEGGLTGYTTTLFLITDENLGIYVATNSLNGLPFNFEDEFLDYFYPYNNNEFNEARKNSNKDYSEYEGAYRSYDGVSKTNIMKIAAIFDSDIKIKDNKDGTLTLNECTQSKEMITTKLVESGKEGIFIREDGRGKFCFRLEEDGSVEYAFNDVSINSYEKVKFFEKSEFIIGVIAVTIIIFIINSISCIVSYLKRRNKKIMKSKSMRLFKVSNMIIGLFNIIGVIGVTSLTVWMCVNSDFSMRYLLYTLLTVLNISAVMTVCNLISLVKYLKNTSYSLNSKVYYILINTANLAFVWILNYFNLLGYKIY